jgi:hypothetical protein
MIPRYLMTTTIGGSIRIPMKTGSNNKRLTAMQSETINELAAALAKAQGKLTGALKDSANPFFKSRYADLASCWDACRQQLSDNGLSVIQTTDVVDGIVVVRTTLAHSSGQWISGVLPVKVKDDGPQAQGSGITYARRYALAAIVGLAQIDDDGEAAQARKKPDTKPDAALMSKIANCSNVVELNALFKALSEDERASNTIHFAARKKELA